MLPFLSKNIKQTGVIVHERKPDETKDDNGMKACAEDILRAIKDNDSEHLAQALNSAFQIFDAAPHEEGPHEASPHTYEAQNQKAGEE